MKKVLSYILISLIIFVNLLAPVSVHAAIDTTTQQNTNPTLGSNTMKISAIAEKTDTTAKVTAKISSDSDVSTVFMGGSITFNIEATLSRVNPDGTKTKVGETIPKLIDKNSPTKDQVFDFGGLDPNTSYAISIVINKVSTNSYSRDPEITKLGELTPELTFITNPKDVTTVVKIGETGMNQTDGSSSNLPPCGITTPMGCVVQVFYYVLFVPTSYLFALAGTMFDYTFAYSVNDTSYRSAFVVQGWGLVRDFCNMFFIFIMLYIAIGTILSLHSVKTKEAIINVVIIGLFINFSLFATQVIIDASNITARVFYNSNAIKITEKGADGVAKATPGLEIGADGTIPLSAAIVNKVNPQNLIMSSGKIKSIKNNSGAGVTGKDDTSLGTAQFILVIIMASAVNIVGFTVFLTVAFLFIARVIGLWLAMILSPVAFFTYILPEMAGAKMIGWKNWWPETLKLAFLAPVFIFFMYIILKFLQADLITDIVGKSMSGDGLGYFVSILVPFAFIMILMLKAKKIATDLSGEFGEMAVKAGSAMSGMVLGGAVGIGAMAMRGTIGKVGDKLDKAGWVNDMAGSKNVFASFLGNKFKDAGQKVASKSFDVRNTEMGAAAGKGMGADVGKGKEGGYTKDRKDFVERKQKRAKEIEVNEDEELTQILNREEMNLQKILNRVAGDFDSIDKRLEAERQRKSDNANSTDPAVIAEFNAATAEIKRLTDVKKAIKNADGASAAAATAAAAAAPLDKDLAAIAAAANACALVGGRSIKQRETEDIPKAKNAKLTKSRERTTGFANATGFWGTNRGMEAEHKIIMETKLDSGAKT